MSDETFEYITTDYMISIESNEQTIQPVEYIVELGQEGIPGKQGEKGDPGFSPTVGYNLSDGHLTFTIVNEDGVTVTPDVFDYVMRKDGSNANNAVNMNRLSILNNLSYGAKIASRYINDTDKMNLEISGYPLRLTGTSFSSDAYSNSITIARGGSSITLGNTTKNNIIIDGTSARYNGAEIATLADIPSVTDFLEVDGSNADSQFTVNGVKLAGNYVYIDGVSYGGIHAIQTNSNIYYQLGVDSNRAFLSMPTLTLNSYPAIGSGGTYSPADTIMNVNSNMRISFSNSKKFYYGSSNIANNEVAIKGDLPTTMTGADGTNAGTSGLVPAPSATDNTKFLKGDGTWADVSGGTSYTAGTGIDITNDTISIDNTVALKSEIPTNADYVDLTTAQTITSIKKFTQNILQNSGHYLYSDGIREPISQNHNIITHSGSNVFVGSTSRSLKLSGTDIRPQYNDADLALLSDIPTVNNSTITFTQGGTTKGSITLNQSSDATIALDAGSSPDNPLEPLTDKEGLVNITSLARSTFDSTKVTVSGSLTISNDGIASGFSASDYIQETLAIAGAWTITCKFNSTDVSSGIQQILNYNGYNRILIAPQGWITIFADENNAASQAFTLFNAGTIVNNTNYYFVLSYDGSSTYTAKLTNLDNGTTMTASATNNYKLIQTSQTWLIGSEKNKYLRGTFDLKYFSVTSNGVNILNYNQTGIDTYTINGSTVTIPYTLSKTGSKIVDSSYRADIETVYNNQGYVRCYTLNEGVNYTLPTPPDKGYLPNLSWVLNNMNSTPDYSAGITMDLGNSDFIAPTKGVIVLVGYTTGGTNVGGILRISINSNVVYTNATNPTGYTYFDLCLPVDSGDVINLLTITTPATINTQKFFPLKEVN